MALLLNNGFYEITPSFAPVPEINPAAASAFCALLGILIHRRIARRAKKLRDGGLALAESAPTTCV